MSTLKNLEKKVLILEKTFPLQKNHRWRRIMSAAESIAANAEALREQIRDAKKKSGLTIDQLSEEAGISKTSTIKLLSNAKVDLRLNDSVALCKFFDLSMDESFGLCRPQIAPATPQDVLDRNRELERENARLAATVDSQRSQIKSTHTICYVLLFISALLAVSLVAYLIIDAQIRNAGLIQGGTLSGAAWAFVALIAAAVVSGGIAILRVIRKEYQHEESQSPRS